MTEIITTTTGLALPTEAKEFMAASRSPRTRENYRIAWAEFTEFCNARAWAPMPASVTAVVAYLIDRSKTVKPSTLAVKLAAISFAHRAAKLPDPCKDSSVQVVMAGIRRQLGTAPNKKTPALFDDVAAMVKMLPADLGGIRDKAILLLGFAGAFRQSELVALDVSDVHFNGVQMTITIRHSKTDQESHGMTKTVPYLDSDLCPAKALKDWLAKANIKSGPIFRKVSAGGKVGKERLTTRSVGMIVKAAAERAGLDATQFSSHSLRAGFITSAAINGAQEWQIQEQSGHKNLTVLRGYIRAAGLGAQSATRAAFGVTA